MENITRDYILKVADLANLEVKETEIEKYQKQLSDIMTEINKIKEVETNILPLRAPYISENDFNNSEVSKISREDALRGASNKDSEYIIVPKVIVWQII